MTALRFTRVLSAALALSVAGTAGCGLLSDYSQLCEAYCHSCEASAAAGSPQPNLKPVPGGGSTAAPRAEADEALVAALRSVRKDAIRNSSAVVLARVEVPPGEAGAGGRVRYEVVAIYPNPQQPGESAGRGTSRPADLFNMLRNHWTPPAPPQAAAPSGPPRVVNTNTEPPRLPYGMVRPVVLVEPATRGPTVTLERDADR